jgi:hypothetical protein
MPNPLDAEHPVYKRYKLRHIMSQDFVIGGLEVMAPSDYVQKLHFAVPVGVDSTGTDDEWETNEQTKFKWVGANASSYLFTHEREKPNRFEQREIRAAHLPIMAPILSAYFDGIQAATPIKYDGKIEPDTSIAEFLKNPTGSDDTFDEIRNDVAMLGMATGICYTYLHFPDASEEANISEFHRRKSAGQPYLRIIAPSQLFYWEVDEYGQFEEVRFWEMSRKLDKDGNPRPRIRVVTKQTSVAYEKKSNDENGKNEWTVVNTVKHALGFVPVSSFYTSKIRWKGNAPVPFCPCLIESTGISLSVFWLCQLKVSVVELTFRYMKPLAMMLKQVRQHTLALKLQLLLDFG